MQILLVFSFIIAFLAIIFAIQNTTVTPIRFFIWQTQGSLALILFIALVAGALISYLATTPSQIKQRMTISNQRKRIAEVEGQLAAKDQQLDQANEQIRVLEEKEKAELPPVSDDQESGEGPEEVKES